METRTVQINGTQFTIPADELPDPHPREAGWGCPSHDAASDAVCTISGRHGDDVMHIAHDGEGQVMAMWDAAHGYRA